MAHLKAPIDLRRQDHTAEYLKSVNVVRSEYESAKGVRREVDH